MKRFVAQTLTYFLFAILLLLLYSGIVCNTYLQSIEAVLCLSPYITSRNECLHTCRYLVVLNNKCSCYALIYYYHILLLLLYSVNVCNTCLPSIGAVLCLSSYITSRNECLRICRYLLVLNHKCSCCALIYCSLIAPKWPAASLLLIFYYCCILYSPINYFIALLCKASLLTNALSHFNEYCSMNSVFILSRLLPTETLILLLSQWIR